MDIKSLFHDDRAVSPVIGVILMVAITVILAAVIGTFVLGLGDQLQQTTPQVQVGFDQEQRTVGSNSYIFVTITHETGDTIAASNLDVTVDGETAFTNDSTGTVQGTFSGDVSAGSSITISSSVSDSNVGSITTGTSDLVDDSGTLGIDFDGGTASDITGVGLASGETVRVVYDNPNSDKTATIAKYEVQ